MVLRAIFWFSLVVMLLPVRNDLTQPGSTDVSGKQTFVLIQSVASDLSGFCGRNPLSCDTAKGLANQFGVRIQAHAESLGEYLTSESQDKDLIVTGSVKSSR